MWTPNAGRSIRQQHHVVAGERLLSLEVETFKDIERSGVRIHRRSHGDGGQATANNIDLPIGFTPVWHRADVCCDFATGVRLASFDGAPSLAGTGVKGWPGVAHVQLGADFSADKPREEDHVDNVLVDTAACP